MKFAEIAVDAPTGYNRTFSYSIPNTLVVKPGHSVIVPFGPQLRQGIVMEVLEEAQVENTRDILEVSDSEELIDDLHLKIVSWLSGYYMCSLFEAASLMIPPGSRTREITWITASEIVFTSEAVIQVISRFQKEILDYLATNGRARLDKITSRFGQNARSAISSLEEYGMIIKDVKRSKNSVSARFKLVPRLTKVGIEALNRQELGRAYRQKEFMQSLYSEETPLTMPEARKSFGTSAVNAVLKKGFINQERIQTFRDPLEGRT